MTSIIADRSMERFFLRSLGASLLAGRATPAVPAPMPSGASQPAEAVHIIEVDPELRRHLADVSASIGVDARIYRDLPSFLKAAPGDIAGCLILDARLALADGEAVNADIFATAVPIVVTACQAAVATAVQAMKAGALDFLEKPFGERRLIEAIEAALLADRGRRSAEARAAELRRRYASLSRREREVMALVTEGKMNKQVAWELGLSEITVKVHRGSAMRKMHARTLADLVRMADALAAHSVLPTPASSRLRVAGILQARRTLEMSDWVPH